MRYVFIICLMYYSPMLWAQTPKTDSLVKQQPRLTSSSIKKTEGSVMLATDDIVTNISRTPELSDFYKALQTAVLTETFKSKGPITVFAPNNKAFAGISAGKLDTLFSTDHKYDLVATLTYHAIPGIVTSKDIVHAINSNKGMATFITLGGTKLMAKLDANRNILLIDENGGQSVISRFDLPQNNGLLFIINSVLIPKFKNI
jgi:uncharacterized surface protein with fasciclin (FAS1) repeats